MTFGFSFDSPYTYGGACTAEKVPYFDLPRKNW